MQPPRDHVCVTSTKPKAAAAVSIGAGLALRGRAGLLEAAAAVLCPDAGVAAGGQVLAALASELPRVNGWSIARHAGDRTPDRTQRLLNHASWDDGGGDGRGAPVRGGRAG